MGISELLTHTSGLPDKEELFFPLIEQEPEKTFNNADIINAMRAGKIPLKFKAGAEWRYNNMGYALLALLVEKVSGESFADYLRTHIFIPAGMKQTHLLNAQASSSANQVTGYFVRAHYLGDLESIDKSKKVRPWSYNMRAFEGLCNLSAPLRNYGS